MNTNAEDLAYPFEQHDGNEVYWHGGLTKREYFAAMAMQGLIANCFNGIGIPDQTHAEKAVELADLLIEALNKNK